MKKHRWIRRVKWGIFLFFATLVALVITLVSTLQSSWGKQQLLAFIVTKINTSGLFQGHLSIGHIDTDYFSTIELTDVLWKDQEGGTVFSVKKLSATYDSKELWQKKIHLNQVTLQEGIFEMRKLKDGSFNLFSLFRPAFAAPSSSPLPFSLQIDQIKGDVQSDYFILSSSLAQALPISMSGISVFKSQMHFQTNLTLNEQEFQMGNMDVDLQVERPLQAKLDLQGGFIQKEHFVVNPTKLSIALSGDQIHKWVPTLATQGKLELNLQLQGLLSQLQTQGELKTNAGLFQITAEGNVEKAELPWRFDLQSQNFSPHSWFVSVPEGNVVFSAKGQGDRDKVALTIEKATGTLWGAQLQGQGEGIFDFHQKSFLWASSSVRAQVPQITSLPIESLKPKQGSLNGQAYLFYTPGSIQLDASVKGKGIRFQEMGLRDLDASFHLHNQQAELSVKGQNAQFGDLLFRNLSLQAKRQQSKILVEGTGQGPYRTLFRLKASALPIFSEENKEKKWIGINSQLVDLHISKSSQTWVLRKIADVQLLWEEGVTISIHNFLFGSGTQQISLQGKYASFGKKFDVSLRSQRLDLNKMVGLFWKKPFLPHTSLGFSLGLHGTLDHPSGNIQIRGSSSKFSALEWQATSYVLSAHINQSGVKGDLSLQSQRTDLKSHFQIPFSARKSIWIDLQGHGPLPLFQKLFPPALQQVQGDFTFQGKLYGSLQKPQLSIEAQLPFFQTKQVFGKDTLFRVRYEHDKLELIGNTSLFNLKGSLLGKAAFDVHTSFAFPAPFSQKKLFFRVGQAPISGEIRVRQVQASQLAQLFSFEQSEVKIGDLRGEATLSGSLASPKVDFSVDSNQVEIPKWFQKTADWVVKGKYEDDQIRFDSTLSQEKEDIANAHGDIRLATIFSEKATGWKEAPIHAQVNFLPFPVQFPFGLSAQIEGQGTVDGTLGNISWSADATAKKTQLANWAVGEIHIHATPEKEGFVLADISVKQEKGGQANAKVHLPLSTTLDLAKIQGELSSKKFLVDYTPKFELAGELRVLKGLVDAQLQFVFPEGQPKVTGTFYLEQGAVGIRSEPRFYSNVKLAFTLTEQKSTQIVQMMLNQLDATVAGGMINAHGTIHFHGAKLEQATVLFHSKRFPLSQGDLGVWLDSDIDVAAHTEQDHFQVDLNVKNGTINVPQLSSDKEVQSLEGTPERIYRTTQVLASSKEKTGALPSLLFLKSIPQKAVINVAIKDANPLVIKGPEVNGKAAGSLAVELDLNGQTKITGSLYALTGVVKLFRKDYDIRQAEVSFDGSIPVIANVYVQLSRPISGGTLYVEAQGTPGKLKSSLRTDPPDYSQSEILTLFRGDAPDSGSAKGQGALNLFAGLIVGQLQEQLGENAKYFLIDTIRVDEDLTSSKEGSARVEFGKNFSVLGGTIYISYSQQFGGDTVGTRKQNRYQGRVEFRLFRNRDLSPKLEFLRNVQLDGSYGDAGVGNIDISYHTRRF